MKKSTKALVAAAAGSALLLGGAGSLALWNADTSLDGVTLNSGELKLGEADCSAWQLTGGGQTVDLGDKLLVPGDVVSKTCTSAITATGANLLANVTTDGPVFDRDVSEFASIDESYSVGDREDATTVTSADGGEDLVTTVTVTFKSTSDNRAQAATAELGDYTVFLTQVASN